MLFSSAHMPVGKSFIFNDLAIIDYMMIFLCYCGNDTWYTPIRGHHVMRVMTE